MAEKIYNCYKIAELIAKDVSQTATEEEKRKLREWVDASPENAQEYAVLLKRLRRELLTEEPASANHAWAECRDRLPRGARRALRWRAIYRYGSAAMWLLVVLFSAGLLWWNHVADDHHLQAAIEPGSKKAILVGEDQQETTLTAQTLLANKLPEVTIHNENGILRYEAPYMDTIARTVYHTLKVPRGGEYQLVLADGTRIYLNAESELIYPVVCSAADTVRRVFVRGEAFFNVAHQDDLPFEVYTKEGRVRVYGTQFNVHNYPEEERTVITLNEGSVGFTYNGEEYRLRPDEQLVAHHQTGYVDIQPVNASTYTAWIDGIFEFSSMPLYQLMQQLARWYDVDYTFESPQLERRLFTGVAFRQAPLATLLEQIEKTTNIHFRIQERTIIISN